MAHYAEWFPFLPLPPLPAIYGLDPFGEVVEIGTQVKSIKVGDRVYVNPGTCCGSCHSCRCGQPINCDAYTFLGYFGFGPRSKQVFVDYPYAGFPEFMTAPASSLVKLPASVSYKAAARLGYLGAAYSALRKAGARAGMSVIVSGATGVGHEDLWRCETRNCSNACVSSPPRGFTCCRPAIARWMNGCAGTPTAWKPTYSSMQ
ncbi:alcohol dehydrogenase catalytic domain-containing protein [Bradyrhizobium sp. DOA9]|uniref:alcohol dehydrogenase catalytic domain-containing protein n=1 Tax=Bradyrhizobium sp. DOA9 TaxID=1126627 RepID=UPI001AECE872